MWVLLAVGAENLEGDSPSVTGFHSADRTLRGETACEPTHSMAHTFSRRRHKQTALSLWYQTKLRRSPFLFFGLPFLSIIVIGSYALSSFTTIRYERNDQKVKIASEEDLLKLDRDRRRPDIREEYNVLSLLCLD